MPENPTFDQFHKIKFAQKLGKSPDHDHTQIFYTDVPDHSVKTFCIEYPKNQNDTYFTVKVAPNVGQSKHRDQNRFISEVAKNINTSNVRPSLPCTYEWADQRYVATGLGRTVSLYHDIAEVSWLSWYSTRSTNSKFWVLFAQDSRLYHMHFLTINCFSITVSSFSRFTWYIIQFLNKQWRLLWLIVVMLESFG